MMEKTLILIIVTSLLGACAAPRPASCDGGNLREINVPRVTQQAEVAQ